LELEFLLSDYAIESIYWLKLRLPKSCPQDPVKAQSCGGARYLRGAGVEQHHSSEDFGLQERPQYLQASWKSMEKNYQAAVESRRNFSEAEEKLTALQQLTTNVSCGVPR